MKVKEKTKETSPVDVRCFYFVTRRHKNQRTRVRGRSSVSKDGEVCVPVGEGWGQDCRGKREEMGSGGGVVEGGRGRLNW